MRFAALCGLGLVALTSSSYAADLPVLRGSSGFIPGERTYFRWEGFYGGGQAGYSSAGFDMSASTQPLTSYMLRESSLQSTLSSWDTLPKANAAGAQYGGFVGYNFQWENAVIGVEANYNHMSLGVAVQDGLTRTNINVGDSPLPDHTYLYDATVASAGSAKLTDVATFRARAGWAAGVFMPYAFGGVAVGRANVTSSASFSGIRKDYQQVCDTLGNCTTSLVGTVALTPMSQTEAKNGVFVYGYTAGLGMDVMLTQNVFLRGEWEWVRFGSLSGYTMSLSSFRGGLGVKF